MRDASWAAWVVGTPSNTPWTAARKSANVGWYLPYAAFRLVNRHSRSIRFRFGE